MKIEKITLENFRCFSQLEINFHPQLTVLVANNGHGKTSILDSIRIALWPFVSQFDLANTSFKDPDKTITIDDMRIVKANSEYTDQMVRRFPTSVTAKGIYGTEITEWKRFRDSEAPKSQTKDDKNTRDLKQFAKNIQKQVRELNQMPVTLPVFGYYGTSRLWKENKIGSKRDQNANDESIRTFAFRDCLNTASSYRQFKDWFIFASKKLFEYQIDQFLLGTKVIEDEPNLINPVKVVQDAVNEVLKPVGWKNLEFSLRNNQALVLQHDEYGLMKVDNLSDGIKNIFAMIADIAYRAVILNGHLGEEAARESPGIVMIDEVDMHLHPQWQQTVIGSIRNAFPNIQFILTTHSPQVLSTVHAESIRILNHSVNPESGVLESTADIAYQQSMGVASADVMAIIQGVDTIPNVEPAHWLSEYKKLIVFDELESDQAKILKDNIISHFGEEHQEWHECERLIRLQKMKAKLPKRSG